MLATLLLSLPVLLLSASVTWWLWFSYSRYCQLLNRLPGPRPWPLVGNSLAVLGANVCENMINVMHDKWPKMYGEFFRIYIASVPGVVVSSPELVESVVNNPCLLDKSSEYRLLHPWLGMGLLTSSGGKWKSRRRLLTPAFHFHIMEDFFDTFNEQSSVLCRKIEELCRLKGKAEINTELLTSLCTLDIICETAMGCKVNAQTKESEYVKAVHRITQLLAQRPMRVWNLVDVIYHLSAQGRDYLRCLKIVRNFTDQVIKARRQHAQLAGRDVEQRDENENGVRKRRPFLDLLMANGTDLGDEDINDEVNTFLFEGHDTTAVTFNWFLYCMASNPQCQDKVYEEVQSVFQGSDRPCTRQDLPNLKYLECCIKETLRLYPSVPAILRLSTDQVVVGNHQLPANCKVGVSIFALHRNPRIYPDPYVYNPDRFLPEQSKGRHAYAFIPFSAGPRNCIGQRFAMAEELVVLSSVLRRFKFELPPTAPRPSPTMELTLKSATGFHLLVSRR